MMEFVFKASYEGKTATLIFSSLGIASKARRYLESRGAKCSEVKPEMSKLRSPEEYAASKEFIQFVKPQ